MGWSRRIAAWAIADLALLLLSVAALIWIRSPSSSSLPSIHSLAVLPLENLSGDASQDYFADGMTDELITHLAQIGDLRVISRVAQAIADQIRVSVNSQQHMALQTPKAVNAEAYDSLGIRNFAAVGGSIFVGCRREAVPMPPISSKNPYDKAGKRWRSIRTLPLATFNWPRRWCRSISTRRPSPNFNGQSNSPGIWPLSTLIFCGRTRDFRSYRGASACSAETVAPECPCASC